MNNATPEKSFSKSTLALLSQVCFIMGFASILGSIAIWFFAKTPDAAHGERFGIFVGLWAPTFFILSDRFKTKATTAAQGSL